MQESLQVKPFIEVPVKRGYRSTFVTIPHKTVILSVETLPRT